MRRILFGAKWFLLQGIAVLIRRRYLIGACTVAGALSATVHLVHRPKLWESVAILRTPSEDSRQTEWDWNRAVWAHELYGTPMPQMTY